MAKILIIDDEVLVRDNISAYLEDEGYSVLATHSAEAGLAKLSVFEPDLVIVDLRLEGISGERFVKTARNLNPSVQFIIHTGSKEYTLPRDLRALDITENNLMFKPIVDLNQLQQLIQAMLNNNKANLSN